MRRAISTRRPRICAHDARPEARFEARAAWTARSGEPLPARHALVTAPDSTTPTGLDHIPATALCDATARMSTTARLAVPAPRLTGRAPIADSQVVLLVQP